MIDSQMVCRIHDIAIRGAETKEVHKFGIAIVGFLRADGMRGIANTNPQSARVLIDVRYESWTNYTECDP